MDNNVTIPYIVYDEEMARQERHIKRLITVIVIVLLMLFGSNIAWLYVWNQYEYVDETETTTTIKATQDGEGVNIVGGEDVSYGSDSSNREEEKTSQEEEEKER